MSDAPPPEVLEAAGLGSDVAVRLPVRQPAWRLETGADFLSLVWRWSGSVESLTWEGDLLGWLEKRSFPCQRAARIFSGRDFVEHGGGWFVARTWCPGEPLSSFGSADLVALGRFMASYHGVVRDLAARQRQDFAGLAQALSRPTDEQLKRVLGDRESARSFRRFADDVVELLGRAPADALPIHGDLTPRNVVAEGPDAPWGLIDFGMAHLSSPAAELANASLGSARPSLEVLGLELEKVADLVRGYASVASLSSGFGAAVADYARARTLVFIAVTAVARAESGVLPRFRLGRVEWLSANRGAVIEAVDEAVQTASLKS